MKQVKVYGKTQEWLRDFEATEDRMIRRGEFSIPLIDFDSLISSASSKKVKINKVEV